MTLHRLALLTTLALTCGCTADEVYDNTQTLRVEECSKELQLDDRYACAEKTRVSYDESRKRHDAAAEDR